MKKVLSWLLVITMMMSVMALPMAVSAEETTTEGTTEDTTTDGTTGDGTTEGDTTTGDTTTEETTPTSKQVVHFNYDFEDYQATGTLSFPKSKTTGVTGGSWETLMSSAGNIVQGVDGNAFHFTKVGTSGMYATYNPTANISSGKWLYSFDIAYNISSTNSRVAWVMNNSSPKYLYFLALQHPTSTTVGSITAMYTRSNGNSLNQGNLFKATDSEKEYTVDVLLDFDQNLATYYVNGVEKTSNVMTATETYTFAGTSFKFNLNNNINKLDNFMLIENPDAQYSFSQKGEVTTESEYITVRFSDTVHLTDINDFIITDANGETAATVTEIEQINGKFYNLKLSNKLNPGTYNLTLADPTLTSVIAGTTSSNTTSAFTVKPEYTYFDMDFEDFTSITSYLTGYGSLGTWTWPSGGSCKAVASNTYQFAGDNTKGIAGTGTDVTKKWRYTLNTPITSGVLRISFDAAFDTTKTTKRDPFVFINNNTDTGCVLNYGKTPQNGGLKYIVSGGAGLRVLDSNKSVPIEDNEPHRWDIVINMDTSTLENYCDGVRFSSVNFGTLQTSITDVSIMLLSAVSFFDNYKVTVNVDNFGYTATDIDTYSNETIVNFDDTMDLADSDLIFTDSEGNTVTPVAITKISPRKYKVMLPDLMEGTYKVELAEGKTSALGNTAKIEYATFNVAERPAQTLYATNLGFTDADGGVTLSATVSNIAESVQKAFLIIGVYKDRVLEECIADVFEIEAGATDVEKTVTLTTDKDLSQYTVRGFVWNRETFSPLIVSVTK